MDNRPSMIKATAIGGLAAAFLSAIPIVSCLNVACCSLLIGGGLLASFLYSREVAAVGGSFTVGDGAKVGLVTALFYVVGSAIASFVTKLIIGGSMAERFEMMREQVESQGNLPPEALDGLEKISAFLNDTGGAVLTFMLLVFAFVLGAIFCTIGGLIGGAVFKKEASVPPAPTQMG